MKIESIELSLSLLKKTMFEMPDENSGVEGLEGTVVNNFKKLSDTILDLEVGLKHMKDVQAVKDLFAKKN